jgi:hypothetical protein
MRYRLPVLAAALCMAVPLHAQNMKPGLWEINNKMQSADGQLESAMADMQKQMAALGPDQRKMMEDMMAQQGIKLSGVGGGGVIVKMCMTRDMVANNQVPLQTEGDCSTTRSKAGPTSMAVRFQCSHPPSHGDGVVNFPSDTHYTMHMQVTSSAGGKDQALTMDADAKWLAAYCGNIKPPILSKP